MRCCTFMIADSQWKVYRSFRIYLISRRFFDCVRLGSNLLGFDLVSDLVSMLLYLDLVNTRILTESLSTSTLRLCITLQSLDCPYDPTTSDLISCHHVANPLSNAFNTSNLASSCVQTVFKPDLLGHSQSKCSHPEGSE